MLAMRKEAPKLVGKCFDDAETAHQKVKFFQNLARKEGRKPGRFTIVKLTIGKHGYGVIRPLGAEEGVEENPRKKKIFL